MSATPDPKDPRFRPFRAFAWATYLVVATVFSLLVTVSVVRSVWRMTPPELPPAPEWSAGDCVRTAKALFDELESQRRRLTDGATVRRADADWLEFRSEWLGRYRQSEAHCHEPKARAAFVRLEEVLDLYTTGAVQLAGEMGPTLDAFRAALDAAQK